jgi:hypothetical protein
LHLKSKRSHPAPNATSTDIADKDLKDRAQCRWETVFCGSTHPAEDTDQLKVIGSFDAGGRYNDAALAISFGNGTSALP